MSSFDIFCKHVKMVKNPAVLSDKGAELFKQHAFSLLRQQGVDGSTLPFEWVVWAIVPFKLGGTTDYSNLVLATSEIAERFHNFIFSQTSGMRQAVRPILFCSYPGQIAWVGPLHWNGVKKLDLTQY